MYKRSRNQNGIYNGKCSVREARAEKRIRPSDCVDSKQIRKVPRTE